MPLGGVLTDAWCPEKVCVLRENQRWENWACRHVAWPRGAAEVHAPSSQGLTKRGPLEKAMAKHFSILALKTP